jgi:methylamine dehydrogenase heavy chain
MRQVFTALVCTLACVLWSPVVHAELPIDTVGTMTMPSAKNRVYVADIAINHIVDGRLHVVDAQSGKYLGLIGTGFAGHSTQSPDGRELYVATTYLSRLQRGERIDVVEVYDADSLRFKYEIKISSNRTQALNHRGYVRTSSDGRLLYVQNATPATSVSVIDLKEKKQVAEIDAPGCWGIYPASKHARRFSSLCGDGTIATFTLDEDGLPAKEAARANSPVFFDGDRDAWFTHAEQLGDQYFFLSFLGRLTAVDLGGAVAQASEPWALVSRADSRLVASPKPRVKGGPVPAPKGSWRPGGYQPFAINAALKRLYVAMHEGGREGSHKTPASEIWVLDMDAKRRLSRAKGVNAISLTTPRSGDAMLYAIDGVKNALVVLNASATKEQQRLAPLGDAVIQLESR